jgi:WD40 repeat protein
MYEVLARVILLRLLIIKMLVFCFWYVQCFFSLNFLEKVVKYNLVLTRNFLIQSKVKDIELKGHTDCVDQLCWDPKHPDTVATAAADKSIRLWDARSK